MVPLVMAGVSALSSASARRKEKRRAAQAELAERSRMNQIAMTQNNINRVFDSAGRRREIADYGNALRGLMGDELQRRRGDEARSSKFALARAGLTGGSVNVDQDRRLGEEFQRAALQVEQRAQGEVEALRDQDEQARIGLLDAASRGLDATTAMRRGTDSMRMNLAQRRTAMGPEMLGDVFARTAATHRAIAERQERKRGFGYTGNRQDLYG